MGTKINKGFIALFCVIASSHLQTFAQSTGSNSEDLIQAVDSITDVSFQYLTTNTTEAEIRMQEALAIADSINYKKGRAIAHQHLSLIYYYQGEYALNAEHIIKAIDLYEELGMLKKAAYQYSSYGYTMKRRNLEDAEFFVRKGMIMSEALKDTAALVDIYDWYGVIKEFRQQLDSALYFYQKSFDLKTIKNDSIGLSYSHKNIGGIHFLNNNFDNALTHLHQAINLGIAVKDSTGLAVNLHNISYIYSAQNDHESAIKYLKQSLKISERTNYIDLARANYEYLTDSYELAGKQDSALYYHRLYKQYSDSIRNAESGKAIAELEVQFKTEQKEKDLAVKNAALIQEQLKVKQRNLMLSILASLIVGGIIIFYLIFRQQKIKQLNIERENKLRVQLANVETENRIHQERERISRDLHDNVGSQITNLITGIEISNLYIKKNEKEEALGLLSSLDTNAREAMTELRETIWLLDKNVIEFNVFIKHLHEYIKRQQPFLKELDVRIKNQVKPALELNPGQSLHLIRIIQESLNNCRKHSGADFINIIFEQEGDMLIITCEDNGKGAQKEAVQDGGNGMKNIQKRITELKGFMEIETAEEEGFKLKVWFPVKFQNNGDNTVPQEETSVNSYAE